MRDIASRGVQGKIKKEERKSSKGYTLRATNVGIEHIGLLITSPEILEQQLTLKNHCTETKALRSTTISLDH
uniref:Uncharacterized protein n=1 Tax=Picea sitchensis TaxID=3332 RepID=A0A6B9XUX6_PICSI|nr:hypothetical protein Q903MT_gene3818 [Picea sitchensis]